MSGTTGGLTRDAVLRSREATQHLSTRGPGTATEVVELLTAVQSQEWAHAFWSLGMRSGLDAGQVQQEFDRGDFLRLHLLRPTWHFVSPADLRWVLRVTSARVQRLAASQYRALGLDAATLTSATDRVCGLLAGGQHLTRAQIGERLARAGLAAAGGRLAHIMMNAELEGLVCSGPMRAAQHTYALCEERVNGPQRDPDDPAAELWLRFVRGHGPTTLHDFSRWSSLTVTAVREAVARVTPALCSAEVDEVTVWWHPDAAQPRAGDEAAPERLTAYLVPLYDEITLSYPKLRYPVVAGHPHPPDADLVWGSVLVQQRNIGLWRRTLRGDAVQIETTLAPGCSDAERVATAVAAERLAGFLGRRLVTADSDERAFAGTPWTTG